jgi:hypothetical protein
MTEVAFEVDDGEVGLWPDRGPLILAVISG